VEPETQLHDDWIKQQASLKAAKAAVEAARQPLLELAEAERAREQAAAGLKQVEEK
jgi:hypothetical protein